MSWWNFGRESRALDEFNGMMEKLRDERAASQNELSSYAEAMERRLNDRDADIERLIRLADMVVKLEMRLDAVMRMVNDLKLDNESRDLAIVELNERVQRCEEATPRPRKKTAMN